MVAGSVRQVLGGLKKPVKQGFHFKRLQVGTQREESSRNRREMGAGPAGGRLLGEGAEVATTVSLKLDLVMQAVSKVKWIGEQALVDGNEGGGRKGLGSFASWDGHCGRRRK